MRIVRRIAFALSVVAVLLVAFADSYFDDHPEKFRELTEQYAWLKWLGSLSNFWAWVILFGVIVPPILIIEVIEFRRRRKSSA